MDLLSVLFRWLHIAAGILWIGLLYWFNFVNASFAGTMDGETRKKVVPELLPRALYFFRWGAAYTAVTGLALLGIVFYHGGLMFDEGSGNNWNVVSVLLVIISLGMFGLYDALAKSGLGKNLKVFGAVGFVIIAVLMYLMKEVAGFGYRAYVIHTGSMFGIIMAANVWMRIWPVQKKVISAVKEGTAPDPALVALAGQRSRHNTYLSVPLVYAMINMHTVVPGSDSMLYMLVAIPLGWLLVAGMYRKAGKVKGF